MLMASMTTRNERRRCHRDPRARRLRGVPQNPCTGRFPTAKSGFRYYNPSTGKWLSRDPLEEDASRNLYGFVDNDGVNFFDLNGLEKGGEALMRLARQNGAAFRNSATTPLTVGRMLPGVPFSFLSGDIFTREQPTTVD